MPIVIRSDIKNLEDDMSAGYVTLRNMMQTRPVEDGEGCEPGQTWADPKSIGVTRGSDTEIRVAADKLIAVIRAIGRTKSVTASKAPKKQPTPAHAAQARPVTTNEPRS